MPGVVVIRPRPRTERDSEPGLANTLPGTVVSNDTGVHSTEEYPLEAGTELGEYRIEAKIGEGAMGTVFSAIHPMIGKRAAIKVLKQHLCRDTVTVERFIDEARVVNQIGHPNIVDIFAFGEMPDSRRYFVMEWLKGETLRERLRRGRLSLTEVAAVIKPLARALEAAHQHNIIHRDLKPENVMLVDLGDEQALVKLLDFGVAKLKNKTDVEKTGAGQIIGTPMYLAPEQARDSDEVGWSSDIYSLGCLMFELLTGRPPFVASTIIEMVTKHVTETPVAPSSLIEEIPEEIDQLVLGMLAKLPLDRPTLVHVRSVLELVKDPADLAAAPRTITVRTATPASGVPQLEMPSTASGRAYVESGSVAVHFTTKTGEQRLQVRAETPSPAPRSAGVPVWIFVAVLVAAVGAVAAVLVAT
jgi:serine/threonine-protein kinase